MPKKYRLTYETPDGRIEAEADDLVSLKSMVSGLIRDMISQQKRIESMSLDQAAQETLWLYKVARQKSGRRRITSSILESSLGVDVSRCYLQNMTVHQIAKWIRDNKGIKVSHSAVGRFCTDLYRIGIAPIGTETAEALKIQGR